MCSAFFPLILILCYRSIPFLVLLRTLSWFTICSWNFLSCTRIEGFLLRFNCLPENSRKAAVSASVSLAFWCYFFSSPRKRPFTLTPKRPQNCIQRCNNPSFLTKKCSPVLSEKVAGWACTLFAYSAKTGRLIKRVQTKANDLRESEAFWLALDLQRELCPDWIWGSCAAFPSWCTMKIYKKKEG